VSASFSTFALAAALSGAAGGAEAPLATWATSVEAGLEHHGVTQGLGDWRAAYIRSVHRDGPDVWNAELLATEAFRDDGVYGSIAWTRTMSPAWFGQIAAGGGSGDFFFPRVRLDALLNYKIGTQLVVTGGVGYIAAKDAHRDRSVYAGAAFYLARSIVLQAGVRLNDSRPGRVHSSSGFLAATHGSEGRQYLVARAGFGREAYQRLTPERSLVDFASRSASLSWKRWVAPRWGFHVGAERYSNAAYRRTGGRAGIFREF
jgi:YaiO family outer membrane protein